MDNVMQTADDVMRRFDKIDALPDVPVDEWIEKVEQWSYNVDFLGNNCTDSYLD